MAAMPILFAITPFLLLLILCFRHTKSGVYALDAKDAGGRGEFEPHEKNYLEIAKLVIGLASASLGGITLVYLSDKAPAALKQHLEWPLVCFVMTVLYG